MMPLTVVNTSETESDRKWGYRFGVEGIVSLEEAAAMLAGCSTRTVERRIEQGLIRPGKHGGRLVICKQSLLDYIASLEK